MSDMYRSDASTDRLPPGTTLNGIFVVDQHIASGGMGDVYRGHAIETGDQVAIKVMRADLADNAMALALFRKEASALHYIHHEAIVRYYVFSNDPGTRRLYLAMEFVDGKPLSDLFGQGPLGFEEVCLLQQRLAAGLDAAHQHGIIHRDLSPDNVLIPSGDVSRAKIIDFGIARSTRLGDGTVIGGGFAGKYAYVSPEQLGLYGGDVTAKSDIYNLGLVLAACLTGRPLDMGDNQFQVIEKRRVVPPLGAIDGRLRPLIEQMLQPDPKDRPESMAAVAAWRPEERPASAALPSPIASRDRGQRRQQRAAEAVPIERPRTGRRLAVAALVLVLLLGIGSIGFYFVPDLLAPSSTPPSLPQAPSLDNTADARRAEDERRAAAEAAKQQAEAERLRAEAERLRAEREAALRREEEERQRRQNEANLKNQGGKFPAVERPSADPKERINQFVSAYDGGDCFFVVPVTVAEGKATLEGYSISSAPFEILDIEFKRQNGFEALIGVHEVTPAQCAAVNFLWRTRNQRGPSPRLDINVAALRSGGALTGTIAEFGDRNVDLLLVSDDGFVHNLTGMLKPMGDTKSFNIRMQKTDPGPAQPQLLIAIADAKPLEALKPAQLGSAEQVFAQLLTEALQSGQSLNVSAKYFKLEK
jgi:serine/threonine protein kinase